MNSRKSHFPRFADTDKMDGQLAEAARIAIAESLKVKSDEKILIVTNPDPDVSLISRALYDATIDVGGRPVLIFQPVKTQLDFAEEAVIAAFESAPDVFISMSAEKLGKDRAGIANPYVHEGKTWDHLFHLQLYGRKTCRSFWSPSTTLESFIRTVQIDYATLKRRCVAIKAILDASVSVQITAPAGTELIVGLNGREAKRDDGDFSMPGQGGNLPAGEVFISPENGTAQGVIVFDGSISLHNGDIVIETPIACSIKDGYITDITGDAEADALRETITLAEQNAYAYDRTGKLPKGAGAVYAKNASNIGELGIGLNPKATITGNMLEDEKAFRTCHFAIGHNYDEDAPALIHLDGLIKFPTIIARMQNGREIEIERNGVLGEEFK